jgi:putative oxidoreductase
MVNLGFVLLRLITGGLLAGHGAQKLFGWFGGYGLKGTSGWLESLGLKPGKYWAYGAGLSEFGGGLLVLLGFLNPLGSIAVIGAMGMAWVKAHLGKPIWVSSGGAELPLVNVAVVSAVALAGPGKYSLEELLGIKLPRWLLIPGLLGVGAFLLLGHQSKPEPQTATSQVQANADNEEVKGANLQAGEESSLK